MTRRSIILTGLMGTGKSTVGRLVAQKSGRRFLDTDEMISAESGRSIADIFKDDGKAVFWAMERQLAERLSGVPGFVIATGERLMLDPLNALLLCGNGSQVFSLTASAEEILAHLSTDLQSRPLLDGPDPKGVLERLLVQQVEGYSQFQAIVTSGKTAAQVAEEILQEVDGSTTRNADLVLTSRIPVRYPGGQYEVVVGRDMLSKMAAITGQTGPCLVVTDENTGPHYGHKLSDMNPLAVITLPAGEQNKNLESVEWLYSQFLEAGLDRSGTLITLGGGVVGDMAGFAAATFMRGISLIQCPTTLLAMVDASVGGKTGVDLPQGKNLVGAFKQPLAVHADLETLETLPASEFTAGLAEALKAGLLASPGLLERLDKLSSPGFGGGRAKVQPERPIPDPRSQNPILQAIIVEAIMIKRDVVETDPFEAGRRKILNLGHTFAHAIEQVSRYRVAHGNAVAVGLVAAARLSALLGHCEETLPQEVESRLRSLGLPTGLDSRLPANALLEAITRDKKVKGGRAQFVLIRKVGDVFVSDDVSEQAVRETFRSIGAGS